MNGVGDNQSLAADMPSIPDLQVLGVEPQIRELAFQWPVTERIDALIKL